MYTVARFLQIAGLTILPLSMFAQLNGTIDVRQLLGFLFVGVLVFTIGYLVQRYSGPGPG
jgi:hypothetical protein